MIEAEKLTKYYGEIRAVEDLDFSIQSGEVVGLLGPNGSGKTSTMRMLTTYLTPTRGRCAVAGYDVVKQAHKVRQSIGYLPESPPLYLELTVSEYLYFVSSLRGMSVRKSKLAVSRVLEECGLTKVAKRLLSQLSKGYKQRAGLAQALVHEPQVIILDEPTSGLDPEQVQEVRGLINGLGQDRSVIVSSHILQEIQQVCSRVLVIARGTLVADGSVEELTRESSLEAFFLEAISLPNS